MKPTCVLVQPGAHGDQCVCAPIAKFYSDQGFEVIWPTGKKFSQIVKRLPYVTHVLLDDSEILHEDWLRSDTMKIEKLDIYKNADLTLDLSDRSGPTYQRVGEENFEMAKFRKSRVDIGLKHTLEWERDEKKEEKLFNLVCPDENYAFAHLTTSHLDRAEIPEGETLKIVEAREIEGFDIFDWIKVIQRANRIYTVESAFACFIDGIIYKLGTKPFLLRRTAASPGTRHMVGLNFDHRFIGETILTG